MPARTKQTPAALSLPLQFCFAVRLLAIVAMVVSGYLLWASWGGSVAGCGPESNCHRVLNSRWAYWLHLPVSALALIVYAGMIGATLGTSPIVPVERQIWARALLTMFAILIAGAALWFIGLQLVVLKSVCPYCLGLHLCGLVAAALVLFPASGSRAGRKRASPPERTSIANPLEAKLSFVGLAGLVALVLGQTLYEPRTYTVKSFVQSTTPQLKPPVTDRSEARSRPEPPPVRQLLLPDGQTQLDLQQVPLFGPATAPYVMVSLVDYTCHHCRVMHGFLAQALRVFSNELAIVSLPMPLAAECNPQVKRTPPQHTNACDYARLGLAVWRANPAALARFDDWMFAPTLPPALEAARQYAEQLVGADALARAMSDQWVARQLQQDVAIYEANYRKFQDTTMPQLILGSHVSFGVFNRLADLLRLLEQHLGLKPGSQP